jgi:hypothetical protein
MDAGISYYRVKPHPAHKPWPNPEKLADAPEDKVIVSSSSKIFRKRAVIRGNYYHHIAGGAFALSSQLIPDFHKRYYESLDTVLNRFPGKIVGSTDQCLFTYLLYEDENLFSFIDHGYGRVFPAMY